MSFLLPPGLSLSRFNSRRERTKFKRAMQRAEWVERQEAKNAWAKALEEEEAKKIPYEVMGGTSFALKKNKLLIWRSTYVKRTWHKV